jgi:hypothetical protein
MILRQSSSLLAQHRRDPAAVHHPTSGGQRIPAALLRSASLAERGQRKQHVVKARGDDEEPDWDKEMSIFKQRTM